ncbi:MAG: hypothetical protein KF819_05270 [Labilithrix sp.]|nr:hypothetical protein [Labilithrix sp.]
MFAFGRAGVIVCLALASCKPAPASSSEPTVASASPQASAMPAPLANAPTTTNSATPTAPEGGPPPVPLRGDVALGPDTLSREGVGYTLSAALRAADVAGPPRAPEVNGAGIDAARKKTELRLAIDLGPSRMRVALLGNGWVLPAETELRARSDRLGHVVVWPGGATYRPLAPGALRALLGERRFDVAPITAAEVVAKEEGGKRIGIRTRKVEVVTRAAKATFEIGRLQELGEGGILLCRMLLDLMNAPPTSAVCGDGELPVRAELRWPSRGSIAFELTGVLKKTDMPATPLLVPPSGAAFAASPFEVAGVHRALSPAELAAFRTGPVDIPAGPYANEEGLVVANATEELRVLHVDGIPVAWAAPATREVVAGLPRGRYIVQWRTFLGEAFEPPVTQSVPGLTQLGGADAGAR